MTKQAVIDQAAEQALADQINAHHQQARAHAETAIDHALAAGEFLLKAKAAAGHGNWRAWLSKNTEIPERTAQRYMQLAKNRADLKTKVATMADLTITGALQLLADDSTTDQELSEREQRDLREFIERCKRRDSELLRLAEARDRAEDGNDIDALETISEDADRLSAECQAIRLCAERTIRKLMGRP